MKDKIEKRKTIAIKIIVSMGLLFLSAVLIFFFVKSGTETSNIIGGNGIDWRIYIAMVAIGIVILLFFPKDIKSYSVKKKWIIGIVAFVILVPLCLALVILSALLFG